MGRGWEERNRPPRLERRYQFPGYDALRDFLDKAAQLSEKEGYYPDMGFGRDYLNVTIHADEESDAISDAQRNFAQQLDDIGGYSEDT
jgi:pterin-4a-carbinolamine dehydratase